ncbi:glycosyltransferase [Aeromonas caviae]|uniref:glycosyltransferase n=1 Tax=Aeromonas caviae TaxID=648 RepID=UPI0038CF61C8
MKKILFLSGIDFKEKSIQVIKKTPEAYVNAGWHVDYIVARDNSSSGNYFYEREININGATLYRTYWPFEKLRGINSRVLFLIFNKFASLLVVMKLAFLGGRCVLKNKYDIIYGYETHGVLAANMLRVLSRGAKVVSRFQGVFYIKEHIKGKRYFSLLYNLDVLLALWLPSNLCIMTNDGTQGEDILKKINSHNLHNFLFISNGVDLKRTSKDVYNSKSYAVMVSRLVKIKRVELALIAVSNFLEKRGFFPIGKIIVVGDGQEYESLTELAIKLNIEHIFEFVGAINNQLVRDILVGSAFCLSLYESSNIGNPFFESMALGIPFVAVNNGDTGKFVTHNYNGFLIDECDILNQLELFFQKAACGILNLDALHLNAVEYSKKNIYTWEKRFAIELSRVDDIL